MANEDIKVKVSVESDIKGVKEVKDAIKSVGDEANNSEKNVSKFTNAIDKIKGSASTLGNMASFVAKLGTAIVGVGSLAAKQGMSLNSEFEKLNNRLTSLIFTADKSSNIDPLQKWENSKSKAAGLIEELKLLDSQLAFTQSDLTEMFASFYSTAQNNMSFETAVKVFKDIAFAAQTSGADVASLKMTLDSLGAGMVSTQTDFGRFVDSAGLKTEKLKQAIADGNFADILSQSLGKFREAAGLAEPTFDALKNSALNSFNEIQRKAAEPMFEGLKKSVDEIGKYLQNDGNELTASFEELYKTIGDMASSAITPENIEAVVGAFTSLLGVVGDLTSALATLSDLAMPDWLAEKEDAGITDGLKMSVDGIKKYIDNLVVFVDEAGDKIGKLFGGKDNGDIFDDFIAQAKNATQEVKTSLENLGATFNNNAIMDVSLIDSSATTDEIAKIDAELKTLQETLKYVQNATISEGRKEHWGETLANLEQSINALESYKQKLKEVNSVKPDNGGLDIEKNNKSALDSYIKSYEKRVKEHDKTIESLKKKEEDLTKSLIDGEQKRADIVNSYAQKRLDSAFSADEKIRRANQTGMSEQQKFYNDQLALATNLSKAKEALLNGDLESYKRFSDLANSLNESLGTEQTFKNGDNESKINRVNDYKNAVMELTNLEGEALSQQEEKELAAHDKKMESIAAELEATRAKIDLEMSFYTELTAMQEKLKNGEIKFDANGFEETKAKMAELDNMLKNGLSGSVNIDNSSATAKVEELKQNLLTLNGKTIEVNADTTPADFGIQKLISEVDSKGNISIKVNPDFKDAQKKIDEAKNETKKPAELKVNADTKEADSKIKDLQKGSNSKHDISVNDSKAKSAIRDLQKNTSSTHTVYVKKVERKAIGGLVDGFKSGGEIFRRRQGKIPGRDLGGSDDVPAMLTRGEFVQNVRAVDYYGASFMHALNTRKIPKSVLGLATGGLVINRSEKSLFSDEFGGKKEKTYDGKIKSLRELIEFIKKALTNPYLYPKTKVYLEETLNKALNMQSKTNEKIDPTDANSINQSLENAKIEEDTISSFNDYLGEIDKEREYIQNAKKEREYDETIDLEALRDFAKTIKDILNKKTNINSNFFPSNLSLLATTTKPQNKMEKPEEKDVKKEYSFLEFLKDKNKFISALSGVSNAINNGINRLSLAPVKKAVSFSLRTHKRYKDGGLVQNFSNGGKLDGYGGGDRNLALLEDGEFVLRKEAVKKWGAGRIKALNELSLPKFQSGGYIGDVNNISNITNGASANKDVNIKFDFGGGKTADVLSDSQTAAAIERYLKGAI